MGAAAEHLVIDVRGHAVDFGNDGTQILALVEKGHGGLAAGNIHHFGIDTDIFPQNRQAAEENEIRIQTGADTAGGGLVDRAGCRRSLHGRIHLRPAEHLHLAFFGKASGEHVEDAVLQKRQILFRIDFKRQYGDALDIGGD